MQRRLRSAGEIVVFKENALTTIAAQPWTGGVIVGAAAAGRVLKSLRELLPQTTLVVFLPEVRRLSRASEFESWSKIFSRADSVWVANFEDLVWIIRTLGPIRTALSTVPSRRPLWPQRRLGGQDSGRVGKGRARRALGDGTVGALNESLRRGAGAFSVLSFHPVRPAQELLTTLENVLRRLPQAGAVVPMAQGDVLSVRGNLGGLNAGQLAATWALRQKGSCCEARILGHTCWVLLRRSAARAAGSFDERFRLPGFAWVDYSLRLRHIGFPVFIAQDFLLDCTRVPIEVGADDDRALLIKKWVRGSLQHGEAVFTASEPPGYRIHPETRIASRGLEIL